MENLKFEQDPTHTHKNVYSKDIFIGGINYHNGSHVFVPAANRFVYYDIDIMEQIVAEIKRLNATAPLTFPESRV